MEALLASLLQMKVLYRIRIQNKMLDEKRNTKNEFTLFEIVLNVHTNDFHTIFYM